MKQSKNLFFYIFLGLLTYWFIITSILPFGYETNDDAVMLLISSGYFTGQPDPHLIFSNIMYGHLLAFLYSFFPNVEWYTVLLVFAQLLSLSIFVFLFVKYQKQSKLFLVALFLISSLFLVVLQFTTVAFLLATSGLILLYFVLQNETQFSYFQLIAAICLLLWSYLIRADVFYVSACVSSLFFLKFLKSKKLWFSGAGLLFLIAIFSYVHKKSYQTEEYSQYFSFNLLRSQLNVFDSRDVYNIDLQKFIKNNPEISENELKLFTEQVTLTKSLTFEKVKELYQYLPPKRLINILEIKIFIVSHPVLLTFIASLIVLAIISKSYILLFSIFLFLTLCIGISSVYILKLRVLLGMFFVLVSFFSITYQFPNIKYSFVIPIVTFLLFVVAIYYPTKEIIKRYPYVAQMEKCSKELKSDGIYINRRAIQLGHMNPFQITQFMKNKKMLFLGWLNHSPLQNKQFDRYFSTTNRTDLFEDLIIHSKEKIFFIGDVSERLQIYLSKYNIEVKKIPNTNSPIYVVK